jgi:hypothetical protein
VVDYVGPIVRIGDEASSDGIEANVRSFLAEAFVATKAMIEEVALPNDAAPR